MFDFCSSVLMIIVELCEARPCRMFRKWITVPVCRYSPFDTTNIPFLAAEMPVAECTCSSEYKTANNLPALHSLFDLHSALPKPSNN